MPLTTIYFACYPHVQLLDVTGPASVFACANDVLGHAHYRVVAVSEGGGSVPTETGLALHCEDMAAHRPAATDTVLVPGASEPALQALHARPRWQQWVVAGCAQAARYGAICTGAFVLAELGLAQDHQVTTHWAAAARLQAAYPRLAVAADALYLRDGRLWTSAGVSTGIDLALAMVDADLGGAVADTVARRLVLYSRRPGLQSQFSPLMDAQARAGAQPRLRALVDWLTAHLDEVLDVPRLAAQAGMSERSLHRLCNTHFGQTPAQLVASLRLDKARQLLAQGLPPKDVVRRSGWGTPSRLARAFTAAYGLSPAVFQQMHGQRAP